ncbi:MAG TPA: DUF3089 domain-containing protein [Ferruginibacter sp.]|nr:DUF3089 domain-containing protein [Ferruginibacter sp.]HRE63484.1 DUF3089 domain-containing protein [Ferruginibacter sp.]
MMKTGLLIFTAAIFTIGCSSNKNIAKENSTQNRPPDYSTLHDWAAHPYKWDPSDSVPSPLRNSIYRDSLVDVFFVHPTTLTSKKNHKSNANLDDEKLNHKTDYSAILFQASAFNEQCRIFAPRYRQAHYGNYFSEDSSQSKIAFDLAYSDVKKAFEFYLENYNAGRPIIIAAHSQGTQHAGKLLKEFFEDKVLMNKLVCAYIVGMPIAEKYFRMLNPCKDSLQTGCFVAWRTFKKGYEGPDYVLKENFKSIVVNPLTWTMDNSYAPASLHEGTVLVKFNKIGKPVDAQIHKNILWTRKPTFPGSIFLTTKNYHIGDINLFYMNIREDVRRRIGLYWKH